MTENFIEKISLEKSGTNFENLYNCNSLNGNIRKYNLKLYLNHLIKEKPTILLVGEAPGHKGCKLTGIPFTSESILSTNLFFKNISFKYINPLGSLETENSATIFWKELDKVDNKPLIWNIFPFHPFPEGNPNKNRTPSYHEMVLGKKYVIELIDIFNIQKIGAIGRLAESMISDIGIDYEYIRHPSYGGKPKFIEGIHQLFL